MGDTLNPVAYSCLIASDGSYVLGGYTWQNNNSDMYLLKVNKEGGFTRMDEPKNNLTFNIYPNPGGDNIRINIHSSDAVSIKIFSIMGMKLFSTYQFKDRSDGEISINTAHLPKATYLIAITKNNIITYGKWIKY